jgi:hypothetical protein
LNEKNYDSAWQSMQNNTLTAMGKNAYNHIKEYSNHKNIILSKSRKAMNRQILLCILFVIAGLAEHHPVYAQKQLGRGSVVKNEKYPDFSYLHGKVLC